MFTRSGGSDNFGVYEIGLAEPFLPLGGSLGSGAN